MSAEPQGVKIPYFTPVLEEFKNGNQDFIQAFGRNAHWGYWSDPKRADGSVQDFARAADEFTRMHLWAGGARDGMHMLDVGCGFGGTLALVNETYSGVSLHGLNIDPRQLERARAEVQPKARAGNKIEFHFGDAVKLPFPDASFDLMTAIECIYHFSSRESFLREAMRVLKPGGRLVVSDYITHGALIPMMKLTMKLFSKQVAEQSGPYSTPWSETQYRASTNALGFNVLPFADVTAQTLPSCDIFIGLLRDKGEYGAKLANGFRQQREMCRLGFVKYLLMTFEKPQ